MAVRASANNYSIQHHQKQLKRHSKTQRSGVAGCKEDVFEPATNTIQYAQGHTTALTEATHQVLDKATSASVLVGCLLIVPATCYSVSQGRICEDNSTCCHTEIEGADQTFHLTQSQHIDTGPTSPSADPIMPGACQDSHWSANF